MTYDYDPPGACTAGPEPGTVVLHEFILENWPRTRNSGIYNCRTANVPGGSWTPSIHGQGRAGDVGLPVVDGSYDLALGDAISAWLIDNAEPLGIQRVIFNRREWDSRPGERRWEDYGGYPHEDHVHYEQHKDAAANLTRADIDALAGRPAPDPARPDPLNVMEHAMAAAVERIRGLYRQSRGKSYDPETEDPGGWNHWMDRLLDCDTLGEVRGVVAEVGALIYIEIQNKQGGG